MARRPLTLASCAALVLSAALLAPQRGLADGTSIDGLPQETMFLLRLRNCAEIVRKFQATSIYKLKDHAAYKAPLEKFWKDLSDEQAKMRQEVGFEVQDLLNLIQGELVIAVGNLDKLIAGIVAENTGAPPDQRVKPGDFPVLLVAHAGESAGAFKEHLGKIHDFLQKEGGRKEEEEFRGGRITTLVNTKADGQHDLEKVYFGELGQHFFVGVHRPYLEAAMAGMSGAAESPLAKHADFAATHQEIQGEKSDATIFVNLRGIFDSLRKNLQANPIFGMFWGVIEQKIIGAGMRNVGISLTIDDKSLAGASFVNTGGARDGLIAILDGPGFAPAAAGKGIPADAVSLSVSSFNFQRFYQLVREFANMVVGMAQGNPGMDVEQLLELQFKVKISEVIAALGTRVQQFEIPRPKAPKKEATEGKGESATEVAGADDAPGLFDNTVISLELKNEEPIRNLLSTLPQILQENLGVPAMNIKSEKYLEKDIWNIEDGEAYLGLFGNQLVFGGDAEAVKNLIRRHGKADADSLADKEDFKKAIAELPAEVWAVSYMRDGFAKASLAAVSDLVKAGGDLPDLEPLLDLFGGGVGFSRWLEKGFYSRTSVALKPAEAGK